MGFVRDLVINVVQKVGWERALFPEPDKTRHLEKLMQISAHLRGPNPSSTIHLFVQQIVVDSSLAILKAMA